MKSEHKLSFVDCLSIKCYIGYS